MTPSGGATWNETVLYRFGGTPDGAYPYGGVVFDRNGALYGATDEGGTSDVGTVFKLAPSGGPIWNETVLHSFGTTPNDGTYPYESVIFGPDGALYGTTEYGGGLGIADCGNGGCGTVFRLAPGNWQETVLYSFSGGSDGAQPLDNPIFGPDGALYGTASYGGAASYCSGCGTVFRLTPSAGSQVHWTETVIYAFGGQPNYNDGANPYASVVFDRYGALYGTTTGGGNSSCSGGCGTVFKLTPTRAGEWSETVLHSFAGEPDGDLPFAGAIFGPGGALYGTTYYGGTDNEGTVYQQSP